MRDAPEPTFDALYRDLILEHYKAPHGKAPLAHADVTVEGMNPICGDELDLALQVDAGKLTGIHVDSRGCAISVSSGSMLHDIVEGKSPEEAREAIAAVKSMLQGGGGANGVDLGDFEALEGVKQFPVRIKCALLPWTTLDQALTELDAKGVKS